MKPISGWENVEARVDKEYKRLVPGGYVCRITNAVDHAEANHLYIEFDITEGDFAGYGASCLERNGFTPLKMRKYYDTNRPETDPSYPDKHAIVVSMFKGFTDTVDASNPTAPAWDWDERKLVGKFIGVILGESEYKKQDGSIGTRMEVVRVVTPAKVRSGHYKVPEKKTLPVEKTALFTAVEASDAELPF